MTDNEIRALAELLRPYRARVEAVWKSSPMRPHAELSGRLLTVPQAAERLGRKRHHIYELVKAGKLPRHFEGAKGRGYLRIAEGDLDAYIRSTEAPLLGSRAKRSS